MKKRIEILLILLTVVLYASCKKAQQLTEFDLYYDAAFTVPALNGIATPVSLPTPDVATNSAVEFSNKGTATNLVKEIRLTTTTLTITNPKGKTFSFLKSVHIYISASGNPDLEIAYLDNVPVNATALTLITTGQVLDNYIKADKFKINAKVVTDETLSEDVTINSSMVFHVKAALL